MAAKVDPEHPGPWKGAGSGAQPSLSGEEEREGAVTEEEDGRMPLCRRRPSALLGSAPGAGMLQNLCSGTTAQAGLVTTFWWIAAVYVTMMFKLATLALPPFTLTWLVNTCTGLLALLLAMALECGAPKLPEMQWEEGLRLAALGLAQGCEFGCLNKSLQYLTVSERTMLQNVNILLIMATAWACGLEKMTSLRFVACALLASGGLLQGLDSGSKSDLAESAQLAHVKGLAFMLTSMLLTAGKWSLVQLVTQRSEPGSALSRMSKLQLAARVQPVAGLVCLGLAGLFEARTLTLEHLLLSGVLLKVPLIAAGITVIQCSELKLVQLTSAVAVGVLMNLHHIPMVLAGVVFFHDSVDSLGLAGFASCLLGGLFYALARYAEATPEKAWGSPRHPKQELSAAGEAAAA